MTPENEKRPGPETPSAGERSTARGAAGNSGEPASQARIPLDGADQLGTAKMVFIPSDAGEAALARAIGLTSVAVPNGAELGRVDLAPLAGKNITLVPRWHRPELEAAIRLGHAVIALNPMPTVQFLRLPDLPNQGGLREFVDQHTARGVGMARIGDLVGESFELNVESFSDVANLFGPAARANEDVPVEQQLTEFLTAICGEDDGTYIEMRAFGDDKTPNAKSVAPVVRFKRSIREFATGLAELNAHGAKYNAGIFIGVLRRKSNTSGKADNVCAGRVLWADIDNKDFPGGEAEARARLKSFPIPPSIIVRTANGLHVYWLLKEADEPSVIERTNKALAKFLSADSAHDCARVLRVPFTYHRKDPANPRRVEIEAMDTSRRVCLSEIVEALELVGANADDPGRSQSSKGATGASAPPPDTSAKKVVLPADILNRGFTPAVTSAMHGDKKLLATWLGTGKSPTGPDGTKRDISASGYDFSTAFELARKGVRDPVDLATALVNRPDGHARGKGREYIARTIESVLERFAAKTVASSSFQLDKVVIYNSDPPTYLVTTRGVEVRLSSGELYSKRRFCQRILEALNWVPEIPTGKGCPSWNEYLNAWLSTATRVEMPPEASAEGALREAIQDAIDGLTVGKEASDLEDGGAVELSDGRVAFKVTALERAMAESVIKADRHRLCRALRELGYESHPRRIGEKTPRLWAKAGAP